MRLAQDGNKGIHWQTATLLLESGSVEKIGAGDGQFITKEMLERYGTTSVVLKNTKITFTCLSLSRIKLCKNEIKGISEGLVLLSLRGIPKPVIAYISTLRSTIIPKGQLVIIQLTFLLSYSLIFASMDSYSIPAKHFRTASNIIWLPDKELPCQFVSGHFPCSL